MCSSDLPHPRKVRDTSLLTPALHTTGSGDLPDASPPFPTQGARALAQSPGAKRRPGRWTVGLPGGMASPAVAPPAVVPGACRTDQDRLRGLEHRRASPGRRTLRALAPSTSAAPGPSLETPVVAGLGAA